MVGQERLLRPLFWAAALFALVMALLPNPPGTHVSDKVQHVIAFATLGVLGRLAYPGAGAVRIIVGLSLFGALIEVLQAIPVLHRDSELLDWVADTIAAAAAVLAVAWWRPRRG